MEEEDDSGYEARSTVTTSNSIYQTDLQQLAYSNHPNLSSSTNSLLNCRPATVNYSSNYSSNSLTISTSTNELRSPRSQNSALVASRPQSSAYSTISSCSLNRAYQPTLIEQQQQYPRLEVYEPLDQFRLLDRVRSDDQFQTSSVPNRRAMSTNRSSNSVHRLQSPTDYEQDWSAGEQEDDDSDYVLDHVLPVHRQLELSPTNLASPRRFRYLADADHSEQNVNEEYSETHHHRLNPDEKVADHQLVTNILNSPLDRSPFSSPLSLPSSNLSHSNESNANSSHSSPTATCLTKHVLSKRQQTKLKLLPAAESFTSSETSSSLESPKSLHSLNSPQSSLDLQLSATPPKQVKSSLPPTNQQHSESQPISEEEFASRKTALRERINNTFRILNSINNNCNRFRTITSRSQELLNQRRQAELEIDNIVQQRNSSANSGTVQQIRLERDLKSATTMQQEEHKRPNIVDTTNTRTMNDEMDSRSEVLDHPALAATASTSKLDKTLQHKFTPTAGDSRTANQLTTTMEFSNPASSNSTNSTYKDTAEQAIDHQITEWPTPSRNQAPMVDYTNSKLAKPIASTDDNQLLSTNNNASASSSSATEDQLKSSISNLNSAEQVNQKKSNFEHPVDKSDLKAYVKSDIKSDLKSDIKSDLKSDHKSYLKSDSKSDLKSDQKNYEAKKLALKELRNSLKNDQVKSDQVKNDKVKSDLPKSDLPKSTRNESRFSSLKTQYKNSKLKNNLKSNLSDIKSDLNDLSDILNIPTTSASGQNVKLMTFVVQPKSVNTDIDSRLMDHILAKICAQRDNQSTTTTTNDNLPSTSNQTSIGERPTRTYAKQRQQTMADKSERPESTESKHCQTDKVSNQDASVCVSENDLKSQEKDTVNEKTIKSGNDERTDDGKRSCERSRKAMMKSENQTDDSSCSRERTCDRMCDCTKRCQSTKQLIDCSHQFNRQESLNHCCIKRTHDSYATFLHHLHPVCLNTFNHNTFTSLPNLTQAQTGRIEQGTNTEPTVDQIRVQANKKDQQTQCILGLSIEEQQREYVEQQQQKYLKLKSEQLKQGDARPTVDDVTGFTPSSTGDQPTAKSPKVSKEEISVNKDAIKSTEDNDMESKRIRKSVDLLPTDHLTNAKSPESSKDKFENAKKLETDNRVERSSGERNLISTHQDEPEDEISSTKKDELLSEKDKTSIPVKVSSDTSEAKKLDITLPVRLPFEQQTSKLGRKLIDLAKEKNVKTHSKIIIEFSGKSKREKSAVDSFTKLDKDGRLTKKTLVSNTKEISVPIKVTKEETANYPLSSTPQQTGEQRTSRQQLDKSTSPSNQLVTNASNVYLYKNEANSSPLLPGNQWKEASHSEITNEMQADPLLDENNQVHPTRSITLSTITTFDQTAHGQPQRIDHSNKYQRCFENPSIHEPVIESNLTMLDEPNLSNHNDQSASDSVHTSNEHLNDEGVIGEESRQQSADKVDTDEINNLRSLSAQQSGAIQPTTSDYRKESELSSSESRSTESRLSNQSSRTGETKHVEEPETNLNSRSASRVSFNLRDNYRDEDSSQQPTASNYSVQSMESNLDRIENVDGRRELAETNLDESTIQRPAGLLETELDDHLFYDERVDDYDPNSLKTDNQPVQDGKQEQKPADEPRERRRKSTKSKERKSSKSSKRKQTGECQPTISDQSSQSVISTQTQPRSTPKMFYDSGFLSPEIYHSSPYELAYKQVNRDRSEPTGDKSREKRSKDKKKSSPEKKKSKSSKNLLRNNEDGLRFTEHSSNTEIITRLTKTSYPSNYKEDAHRTTEKSIKHLKRNKMVLDQILNSPEIKSSSTKKSSRTDKKKKSGCKISSQITMDLPVYKEEKDKQKTNKPVGYPVKSVSLEELDKERDLDRKSIVSQHSYSQQSGEFNTMTKFQRYKPSKSKKNKSAIQLNQPDETNWEYTMQCNCVNGSKANVLTNVKHRRRSELLFFPLQQYETSL